MARGARSEEGWKTGLSLRIFPKIAIYGLILAGISQGYGEVAAAIFYSGIMGITLTSLVKNASVLNWVSGELANFLERNVDRNKNIIAKEIQDDDKHTESVKAHNSTRSVGKKSDSKKT